MSEAELALVPLNGAPLEGKWFSCPAVSGPARRLIVFVHGFNGRALKTWRAFPDGVQQSEWWRASDLLFVGYDSMHREIDAVASYLRDWIKTVYPTVTPGALPHSTPTGIERKPYEQLILVGHSLGGVILRKMLLEALKRHTEQAQADPTVEVDPLFNARLVLFAPANAGFGPSGLLGVLKETGFWSGINAVLSHAPAYNDLSDKDHVRLKKLEEETLAAVDTHPYGEVLRAHTLWADPDGVVSTIAYTRDHEPSWVHTRSHTTVCKPDTDYPLPWHFVEQKALL